jgi:hypothetical protein
MNQARSALLRSDGTVNVGYADHSWSGKMGVLFGVRLRHQPRKSLLQLELEVVAGNRIRLLRGRIQPERANVHWLAKHQHSTAPSLALTTLYKPFRTRALGEVTPVGRQGAGNLYYVLPTVRLIRSG